MKNPTDILAFWFSPRVAADWFRRNPQLDDGIRREFGETYALARANKLAAWSNSAEGALALVILLDQFSRNMFRGAPAAFAADTQALASAHAAMARGFDRKVAKEQRHFFYMPFMHSEQLDMQEKSVELFQELGDEGGIDYAIQHRDIIAEFGRFPHRNQMLGRVSTLEEIEFLKAHKGF